MALKEPPAKHGQHSVSHYERCLILRGAKQDAVHVHGMAWAADTIRVLLTNMALTSARQGERCKLESGAKGPTMGPPADME